MSSNFAEDAPYVQDLKRYLLKLPHKTSRCTKVVGNDIKRALYKSASLNGKYIDYFFPKEEDVNKLRYDLFNGTSDTLFPNASMSDADIIKDVLNRNSAGQHEQRSAGSSSSSTSKSFYNWNMRSLDPNNPDAKEENPYHSGRPCVRKFKKGEPTYRCLTCGLDETCVICQYCFNPDDHVDHQVTISISQRDCGGVCDCGDPEAWVQPFHCKYHDLPEEPAKEIPEELKLAISRTVDACLDYMIDVLSMSDLAVQKFTSVRQVMFKQSISRLDAKAYGEPDGPEIGKYALCIWNDEKHSFFDAIQAIQSATAKSIKFARMVTSHVDEYGRAMVEVSDNIEMLLQHKRTMESTGLANSVIDQVSLFREEMCDYIGNWLDEISKSSICGNHEILRQIVGESLIKPWKFGTAYLLASDPSLIPLPALESEYYRSLNKAMLPAMLHGLFIPDSRNNIPLSSGLDLEDSPDLDMDSPSTENDANDLDFNYDSQAEATYVNNGDDTYLNSEWTSDYVQLDNSEYLDTQIKVENAANLNRTAHYQLAHVKNPKRMWGFWSKGISEKVFEGKIAARVQYLIFFDTRLWKQLRMVLRDLFICSLVSSPTYKKELGMLYAEVYPQVAELYISLDREPECSIVTSLSTQLFTTPSISSEMVQHDTLTRILAALATFFTTTKVGSPLAVSPNGFVSTINQVMKSHRFSQLFHDVEYILSKNSLPRLVTGSLTRISQVCDFILLFQGLSPLKREKETHVEYESETWVFFFNTLPFVLQLSFAVGKGIAACTREEVVSSTRQVARFLSDWALHYYDSRLKESEILDPSRSLQYIECGYGSKRSVSTIVKFRVDEGLVSLHHPLHAFLSWLIEYGNFQSREELRNALIPSNVIPGSEEETLGYMLDHPIRVLSLLSQIQVGLWVRNGFTVRSQLHYYREFTLRDSAFFRDVFMVQCALVVMQPETAFLTLQARWSLLQWKTDKLYDENQRIYLIEEFLHFLIAFVVERNYLQGLDEKEVKRKYITKEIIQCLATRNLSFSDICKVIPDVLSGDEMFEYILRDMTDFRPPTGIRDYGMYSLKEEFLFKFDSHYVHFSGAKIEESKIVKEKIAKATNQPVQAIVLEPPIEVIERGPFVDLAAFARTAAFARFINELLVFIIDSNHGPYENVIDYVLQLIHVVALDDLNVMKTLSIPLEESFCFLMCEPRSPAESRSIVELLAELKRYSAFHDFKSKIDRIIRLLCERSESLVMSRLTKTNFSYETLESLVTKEKADDYDGEETDELKRKRLGKHFQEKALEQMRQQQQLFAQNNMVDDDNDDDNSTDDDDDDEDQRMDKAISTAESGSFPSDNCIMCRMPSTKNSVSGIMGYIMQSDVNRNVPFDDIDWLLEAYGCTKGLDENIDDDTYTEAGSDAWKNYRREFREANPIGPGFPSSGKIGSTRVLSGCGHTIHYLCYLEHMKATSDRSLQVNRNTPENAAKGEYLCPLCKGLNNAFIPVLWKKNSRSLQELLKINEYGEKDYPETMTDEKFLSRLDPERLDKSYEEFRRSGAEAVIQDGVRNLVPNFGKLLFTSVYGEESEEALRDDARYSLQQELVNSRDLFHGYFGDSSTVQNAMFAFLADSIVDLEISLRGKPHSNPMGGLLIDQISPHNLLQLRVATESCKTLLVNSVLSGDILLKMRPYSLFWPFENGPDPFKDFVVTSMFVGPALGLEVPEVLRIQMVGCILKFLTAIIVRVNGKNDWVNSPMLLNLPIHKDAENDELMVSFADIITTLRGKMEGDYRSPNTVVWQNPQFIRVVYSMLRRQLLPFLRQCTVLVYLMAGSGYDPYNYMGYESGMELEKLCDFLSVPYLNEVLTKIATVGTVERRIAEIYHSNDHQVFNIDVEYPGVVRLLHLPRRLDEFFSIAQRSSRKELPTDPALCLFCGQICGMQQPARLGSDVGQCTSHMKSCGKHIGIFLLPKRSSLLLLYGTQGSFAEGPYLDLHGEPDETMRRGRPQFLNQARYDHFARVYWLQHGLVSYIVRKLDSSVDNGGWETL